MKEQTKQIIEITLSFSLLALIAGLFGLFFKPTITGAVVLNNDFAKSSFESFSVYLIVALIFLVIYALYVNKKK